MKHENDISKLMNDLSPIVSEFETQQQVAAYEAWLAKKVERSLADPRPVVAHDNAMARIEAIITNVNSPAKP
jgi:hypothetical protein